MMRGQCKANHDENLPTCDFIINSSTGKSIFCVWEVPLVTLHNMSPLEKLKGENLHFTPKGKGLSSSYVLKRIKRVIDNF